ncbi:xanthine dehydrogenase isoform X1 [Diabrotica virgifera virgifera]|uniref:Xanthine dehydrogenase-like n=1 Tax=Diabrotica virgifera virgifera TaxID=50390 RepID=A0A6P7EZ14_DIAVI|nr:xanthine dehydrogenase isoform X1 [Diabrotica virgifera virgifera]
MEHTETITLTVNEKQYTLNTSDVKAGDSLNSYLRDVLHLTGTKRMCFEGGCGTCTVAVEETVDGIPNIYSVMSCLMPLLSCDGKTIHTVEGIGNPIKGYHKIQKTLAENYGTQCGFCTPGMVMNMYALSESGVKTEREIEDSFGGNICRCTGYRPILKAFKELIDKEPIADIEDLKICPSTGKTCNNGCKNKQTKVLELGDAKWVQVNSLKDLLSTLNRVTTTNYMLVSGNTAKGVKRSLGNADFYIDIQNVPEINGYSITEKCLTLGGNVNLTQLMHICHENSQKTNYSFLDTIEKHLAWVATVQIRNVGSIAGNLMIKYKDNEFQSDVFILLETFKASIITVDVHGKETSTTAQEFLKLDMTKRVIKSIVLHSLADTLKFGSYKIMRRAQNAHALVNAAFLVELNSKNVVQSATIVYGCINKDFIHASATEALLKGKTLFSNDTLQQVFDSLNKELDCDYAPPDPSPEFRKNLAIALFYKFILKICPEDIVLEKYKSGGTLLDRPISTGTQEYGTNEDEWPLTQPIPKLESLVQCSGEAEYVMDKPIRPHEVFCSFVTAQALPGSKIVTIDASKALALPGVVAFYDINDIPGSNVFTPTDVSVFSVEEELFCSGTVKYYNQPIGIIVTESLSLTFTAIPLVSVTYEAPTSKPYLDVRDVVKDNVESRIELQDTNERTRTGDDVKKVVKGDIYLGAQYHFHMEVQSCKVVPHEDGIDIFPASQWTDGNHIGAAVVLNLPTNKINVKVKRLGGGFGGKMFRSAIVSSATALAAYKLKRPATMIMSFEQNMNIIGKRYPTYVTYEVGVNDAGVIQYWDSKVYSDFGLGGNEPLGDMLMDGVRNCYDVSTWEFSAYKVTTDTAPGSYTRAPGTLEGICTTEVIFDEIAYALNLDPMDVRLANITIPQIPKYLEDLKSWADVENRKTAVAKFNKENRWKKQGLSIVPIEWYLEVAATYSVVVSIFHADGGVAITHAGIEMGQGINTKAAQVCAYKFGIPLEKVSVKPTYNFVNPNATNTGGSLTSEAIAYSVIKACDKLLERMQPIKDQLEDKSWEKVVTASFAANIQLNATGFFGTEDPMIQKYPIYGICCTTVEVDLLTGKHEMLQVDIIEDLGESMSPLVDIGQIEGAFVMGVGYFTTEELIFDKDGQLLTNRTWTYKPPGAKDIPQKFNVKFAENSPNPVGVLKSKAVAEPPLCLTVSVPLAIRHALASARQNSDATKALTAPVDGPLTVEKVFLNALNDYKQYVLN